jgi:hypothetical protein
MRSGLSHLDRLRPVSMVASDSFVSILISFGLVGLDVCWGFSHCLTDVHEIPASRACLIPAAEFGTGVLDA